MPRAALALVLAVLAAGAAWAALRGPDPAPPVHVADHGFRVVHRSAGPPVVWAIGDGADGSANSRRVAARVTSEDPDAVLYLGDVYERGTREDFERKMRAPYRALLQRMLPTPGNHEWPRHDEGYDPFWKSVTGRRTAPWYTTKLGGWQIISLNSEAPHGPRSAQVRWLREQLRNAGGTCRIALWHRPRFSAGRHGDHDDTRTFWDALRGHAVLVLGGHDHDLQRLKPIQGMVQIVSGAGGRHRYRVDHGDPRLAFSDDDHFGGVRLTLHPARADLAFVTGSGRVLDRGSVRCRSA